MIKIGPNKNGKINAEKISIIFVLVVLSKRKPLHNVNHIFLSKISKAFHGDPNFQKVTVIVFRYVKHLQKIIKLQ